MRKTFVVGKLTGNSTHILLVDACAGASAPLIQAIQALRPELSVADRLPDPHTIH